MSVAAKLVRTLAVVLRMGFSSFGAEPFRSLPRLRPGTI
jgi:hypothetical protein